MAKKTTGTDKVKRGMAEMQKGGVIMDVVNAEQAKIAEAAGAVAVMALERVPADIRAAGGVARMANPKIIEEVMKAVTIPVMAKARIGHIVEAKVLEALGVDYIDESEVLTPADEEFHINKKAFTVAQQKHFRHPAGHKHVADAQVVGHLVRHTLFKNAVVHGIHLHICAFIAR